MGVSSFRPDEGGDIHVPPATSGKSLRAFVPVNISTGGGGNTLPLLEQSIKYSSTADDDTRLALSTCVVLNPTPLRMRWYTNDCCYCIIPEGDDGDQLAAGWPKLVQAIESRGGSRPVFLYSKRLEASDVNGDLNRLLLTKEETLMAFLNAAEAVAVDESRGLRRILGVDGGGESYSLGMKKWHSLKMTVINCDWNKLVAANNAQIGDFVKIWGFRYTNHANLALAISFH